MSSFAPPTDLPSIHEVLDFGEDSDFYTDTCSLTQYRFVFRFTWYESVEGAGDLVKREAFHYEDVLLPGGWGAANDYARFAVYTINAALKKRSDDKHAWRRLALKSIETFESHKALTPSNIERVRKHLAENDEFGPKRRRVPATTA